jgi:ribosomal protein L6P/L9E
MKKNFIITISSNIKCIFDSKKNILLLKGVSNFLLIQLETKLIVNYFCNYICVTKTPHYFNQKKNKSYFKNYRGRVSASIKHFIYKSRILYYRKLNLIGVGYKANLLENFTQSILELKLGYSHSIYILLPRKIKVLCPTSSTIYIFGDSYFDIEHIASLIRAYRKPEFYKGKGVFKEYEKIILKEGKKTQ